MPTWRSSFPSPGSRLSRKPRASVKRATSAQSSWKGGRVASEHGVDLVDLSTAIIEALAAPDGEQRFYPAEELRAFCAVQFAVAARIQEPLLDQAFAASSAEPPSESAVENLGYVAQHVLDEQGLAPAVDALVAIISADDIEAALGT